MVPGCIHRLASLCEQYALPRYHSFRAPREIQDRVHQ